MTAKLLSFLKKQIGKMLVGFCFAFFYIVEFGLILPFSILYYLVFWRLPSKLIRFNIDFFSTAINDIEENFGLPKTTRLF